MAVPKATPSEMAVQGLHNHQFTLQSYVYLLSYIWANDGKVQEALHVREVLKSKCVIIQFITC